MANTDPAYGSSYPALWWQDLRDRMQGQNARANARWGWVKPPEVRGKLVWLRAGSSVRSLLLASELLAAIRHKRYDLNLVLTFENDLSEIYAPRLKGLRKIAVGYGCCDRPASIKRMLNNLQPYGVIIVGDTPGENFLQLVPQQVEHTVLFQQNPMPTVSGVEACYPLSSDTACECHTEFTAADVMTMLVQQQVEPSFGGIIRGEHSNMPIWAISGVDLVQLPEFLKAWQQHELSAQSLICLTPAVYSDAEATHQTAQSFGYHSQRLSHWSRDAVQPGSVLVVDEPRWLAAVSASVTAQQLLSDNRDLFWQALAGGSACSVKSGIVTPLELERIDQWQTLFARWQEFVVTPVLARQQGDACRKLFWQQRRAAENMLDDLLNRVYNW